MTRLLFCLSLTMGTVNASTDINLITTPTAPYGPNRIVLESIPSDIWYQNIYLIADQINWMTYKNFTLQVGDMGSLIYNFPNWYHGKYDPGLYKSDLNSDSLEDIIIVLNNDIAPSENPIKDIHILNQIHDPNRRYEEATVEPIQSVLDQLLKIDQQDNIVSFTTGEKTYNMDISKYHFDNPRKPFVSIETLDYSVLKGKLYGILGAYVHQDNHIFPGYIGNCTFEYFWDGKMYKVKSVVFTEAPTK